MKRILCFGDSNTYAYDPVSNGRYGPDIRWTRLLQTELGADYEIIEEGLCGRTTVFDDPINEGMNGMRYLYPCLMSHAPFDTMILMLGTNDSKDRFCATPKNITDGLKLLIEKAQRLPVWTGKPDIIVVSPTPIRAGVLDTPIAGEVGEHSILKTEQLAPCFRACAELTGCRFTDAADATVNNIDFMHLDVPGHRLLADRLLPMVK